MGHNSNFLPQFIATMENSLESIRLQNQLQFTNEACFHARGWVWSAFGQCLAVMHGQWSAGFCLQHLRVINVVRQLLGATVQAGAGTELCEQAGGLQGV